jgi:hypothetical protein
VDEYVSNLSYSNSFVPNLSFGYFDAFSGAGTGGQSWSGGGYLGFLVNGNQGWLQLKHIPGTLTLGQFAYDDTGAALAAGHGGVPPPPIPEPGTLAMLALGAAGLLAWRKHRQKQAEKEQQDTEKDS